MPPPTHIVTMPYLRLPALQFLQQLAVSLAPVQPSGWPSAIAPPLTFTFAGSSPSCLDHRQRLRREGLVQLDEVDLVERQAGQLERLGDRVHRADAHLFRQAPGIGEGHEARQRLEAQRCGALGGHHHRGGRAVGRLRRVARRHRALGVERRLELRQRLERGVGARPFVHLELDLGLRSLRLRIRRR